MCNFLCLCVGCRIFGFATLKRQKKTLKYSGVDSQLNQVLHTHTKSYFISLKLDFELKWAKIEHVKRLCWRCVGIAVELQLPAKKKKPKKKVLLNATLALASADAYTRNERSGETFAIDSLKRHTVNFVHFEIQTRISYFFFFAFFVFSRSFVFSSIFVSFSLICPVRCRFFFYSLVCFVWSTNNLLFMSSLRFVCLRCVSVAQAENNCRCVDERRFVEWISRWIWFGLGVFSLSQNERKKVQKLMHARSDMNSENRFLIASV